MKRPLGQKRIDIFVAFSFQRKRAEGVASANLSIELDRM